MKKRTKLSFYLPRILASVLITWGLTAVFTLQTTYSGMDAQQRKLTQTFNLYSSVSKEGLPGMFWESLGQHEKGPAYTEFILNYYAYPSIFFSNGLFSTLSRRFILYPHVDVLNYHDTAVRVVDLETGKEYTNEYGIVLYFYLNDVRGMQYAEQFGGRWQYLEIDDMMEDLQTYCSEQKQLMGHFSYYLFDKFLYPEVQIETVYEKDGLFYPGIVKYGYCINGDVDQFVLKKTADLTPAWATADNMLAEDSYNVYKAPTLPDSKTWEIFRTEENVEDDELNEISLSAFITTEDGKEYQLYCYDRYPFRTVFWFQFTIPALLFGIIAALLALPFGARAHRRYQMEEHLRNLTDMLAHDLKTPLAIISGSAENLCNHVHTEKREMYAASILESTENINSLINSVLHFSKLEYAECKKKETPYDCIALIRELLPALQTDEKQCNIRIEGTCMIRADKDMMRHVFTNLLENALKYSPEGAEISISAEKKRLTIRNPFQGTLKSDGKTLCKPFEKGDTARTDRSGHGLGLAIAQRILQQYRYQLKVQHADGVFTVIIRF